jgi:cytoskeletal protein CcmA (bactofilin family)
MTQDSIIRAKNIPNIVSNAWRSISVSARPVIARFKTIPCDECSQPIRVWNGRIWLIDGGRWAHSRCWKGSLFTEQNFQFLADELGQGQTKSRELPPSLPLRSGPRQNGPAINKLQWRAAPAIAPPAVGRREAQQQAEEIEAKTLTEKKAEGARSLSKAIETSRTTSSCIGRGARISGKFEFCDVAKIEGEAEGEISGDEIEISASAVVRARISANRLKVGGQVNAEIVARERLEMLSTARLRGPITTSALVVAEGAQFEGDCIMLRGCTSTALSGSHETKENGVSLSVTPAQRVKLREHGYSDEDIAQMRSADAHRITGLE